jgi:hypothetical protein
LSKYSEEAKAKLKELEMDVPAPDPKAEAHMRYEEENHTNPGILRRTVGFALTNPDHSSAAKSGAPQMNNPKASVPVSVPAPTEAGTFNGDVTVAPATTAPAATDTPAPAADNSKGKQGASSNDKKKK